MDADEKEEQSEPTAPAAPDAPKPSRTERRVQAARDSLRTLIRDLYLEKFGAANPETPDMELDVRIRTQPNDQWSIHFDPPLVDQLVDQMADAQAERDVFRPGAVYCFRCRSSTCEHAYPPGSLSVFGGYDSAGRPGWQELVQAFVEHRDARAEHLYDKAPHILALFEPGRLLRGKQLSTFGRSSKTYSVLGQVVAGYFACPPAASAPQNGDGRLAVSFQVVETRDHQRRMKLRLNLLAQLPDGSGVDELLGTGWEPSLFRARALATRALDDLQHRVDAAHERGESDDARALMHEIPRILRDLAEHIERGERQSRRRTKHVEERRKEHRPVQKAMDDALSASITALFYDIKAKTFMVCGDKGRTHAFSPKGRHVTSFMLKPGAVAFRVRTGRWRPLDANEASDLKTQLRHATTSRRQEMVAS